MKKLGLILFIVADLALITACILFLASRIVPQKVPFMAGLIPSSVSNSPATATVTPSAGSTSPINALPLVEPPADANAKPGASGSRKILFAYRSSRPKKVMIRADFTGWRAEPMEKDPATQTWKYMAVLEPGEYSYLFSVDDKPTRDPANKRTKKVGTTIVSSLVVGPPASAVK